MAITGTESRYQDMRLLVEELLVDGSPVVGGGVQPATIAPLTGTVGTANDAMTAVAAATAASTDTSAASLASVNTSITAINNNLADLQAKVNALIAAIAP